MDIDQMRKELNDIDVVLVDYFQKRMKLVKEISSYKKRSKLPIKNEEIENEKLKSLLSRVDDEFKQTSLSFLMNLLKISREYQADIQDLPD